MTDPLQCMRPLRKIATAKGHWAASARPPPTTDSCARRVGEGIAAPLDGATAGRSTEAQARMASTLRFRRLIFDLPLYGPA